MKPLYELSAQHKNLLSILDSAEDESIDHDSVDMMLASLTGEIQEKGTSIASIIKNLESHSDAIKLAEDKMKDRRKNVDKNITKLKTYLLNCLQESKIDKITGDQFDIIIKNNPPSVDIFSENLLPKEYFRTKTIVEADKSKIKEDIKNGIEVQGAKLTQSQRLDIK